MTKTYVITGANSGLGFATTKALTDRGAHVIMAVRDGNKGREAQTRLTGGSSEVRVVDLADLASVRAFADGIERADVLINNAGVMGLPRTLSAQGFELQFAVNHLAHFALTGLLLDRIADRVVTVSSTLHKRGRLDFDDLNAEHGYRHGTAYNQSKLANVVFGLELQRRLRGSSLRSVLAHPGYAATSLQAKTQPGLYRRALLLGNRFLAASAEEGARPTVFAATDPAVTGGQFIGPGGLGEMRGAPRVVQPARKATDPRVAERLWSVSERLTGVRYLSTTVG
ncbi:oxidoreductase [Paractinoplanes abujensis]|uniref:NAD(P)-dependent dehydrogenase (Short-subunit alcohol dehydrogenase family) n=1 Tax=Paractinoplanes abujensis TaxID=882441 RepID=A0A7W7FZL7_9ACTN|nr:oxidoreductase [Actinoplanes abujensis]MBB4690235.1 NAD(P)-dependent dehydrogenase (short-subunit alcohol dehydrogenase family) [Actinoplanes abujensis]